LENVEWDKVDTIIHLAGKAHDTKNTSSEQEYFDINVGLTQIIFQKFLISSASKFIFFSSVMVVAKRAMARLLEKMMLITQKKQMNAEFYHEN
jgi:UDP-glucose 4-epimerase